MGFRVSGSGFREWKGECKLLGCYRGYYKYPFLHLLLATGK